MKKVYLIIYLIISPAVTLASSANDVFPNEVPKNDIQGLVGIVINSLLGLSASVAVWFLIIGGFQYITSAGNPDSTMKAKNTILYAIIGLLVIIGSYAVITFIINAF